MTRNLRDCKAWRDDNLPISTSSNESAKLMDEVLYQLYEFTENPQYGGIKGTFKLLSEADPHFVLGKTLMVGLSVLGGAKIDDTLQCSIDSLKESYVRNEGMNKRERLHVAAVLKYANGKRGEACSIWNDIVNEYPNYLLAIELAYYGYLHSGNSTMIRDTVGRVLPYWNKTHSFYSFLEGMYAFGLEETNLYDLADKYAVDALSLNHENAWAVHARAHCFEMTSQTSKGINFMKSYEKGWSKAGMLACHNYWHWGLYHIENGDYEEALGVYDQHIKAITKPDSKFNMIDGSSLLARLEFQGMDVGKRWDSLFELCRPFQEDHTNIFDDAHFLISYLQSDKGTEEKIVENFIESMKSGIPNMKGMDKDLYSTVGLDLCLSIVANYEKRYDDAVELLYPLKNEIWRVGGSKAQRELFELLLIQACIKSSKSINIKRGFALLRERKLLKENSPLTDRLMNSMLSSHVDFSH